MRLKRGLNIERWVRKCLIVNWQEPERRAAMDRGGSKGPLLRLDGAEMPRRRPWMSQRGAFLPRQPRCSPGRPRGAKLQPSSLSEPVFAVLCPGLTKLCMCSRLPADRGLLTGPCPHSAPRAVTAKTRASPASCALTACQSPCGALLISSFNAHGDSVGLCTSFLLLL